MKNLYLSLTIIFVVLLAGCTTKTSTTVQSTETPVTQEQSKAEVESNAKKFANAMSAGKSVKCVIAKADGSDSITFMVKGKKTKAMGTSLSGGKGTGYMLNDSEYVYIWNDSDKKGIKMSLALAAPSGSPNAQYQDFGQEGVEKDYIEKGYTYNCNEESVADSEFVIPKDVTFSDMAALMEQTKKLQASPGKTPSAEDMKQIEEMMKQYQQ